MGCKYFRIKAIYKKNQIDTTDTGSPNSAAQIPIYYPAGLIEKSISFGTSCHRAIVPFQLSIEDPAGAVFAAQQSVCFGTVSDAAAGTVVLNFLADAIGYETQQHHFDRRAAVIEIA